MYYLYVLPPIVVIESAFVFSPSIVIGAHPLKEVHNAHNPAILPKCRLHVPSAGLNSKLQPKKVRKLWKYFFTRRFFVSHLSLSESELYCWYRCYATPLKHTGPWFPRYACM